MTSPRGGLARLGKLSARPDDIDIESLIVVVSVLFSYPRLLRLVESLARLTGPQSYQNVLALFTLNASHGAASSHIAISKSENNLSRARILRNEKFMFIEEVIQWSER